jgi:hypothetical protein
MTTKPTTTDLHTLHSLGSSLPLVPVPSGRLLLLLLLLPQQLRLEAEGSSWSSSSR